jgi:hypothetical protein
MELSGQLHTQAALHLGKGPPVYLELEPGWARHSDWMLCRKKIDPSGNRRPDRQARSLVTIQSMISRFLSERETSIKYSSSKFVFELTPAAAKSKAWICGRAIVGIVVSNPTGGMEICVLCVFVLSGRGLCDGPIPRPEESYLLWCMCECDQMKSKTLDIYREQVGRRRKD